MAEVGERGGPERSRSARVHLPAGARGVLAEVSQRDLKHAPEIPPRMERNIRRRAEIPDGETLHAFLDCTVLNSGKDGLAFGDLGLWYAHMNNRARSELEAAPRFLSWADLARHRCEPLDDPGIGIRIGPWRYEFGGSSLDTAVLCELLHGIGEQVRQGNEVNESPATAVDSPTIDAPAGSGSAVAAVVEPEPEDNSIDAGVAVFLGVPLAIVAALVAVATMWLAAPWGPTSTEAGVVTEIDVDFTAGGPRMGGHWWVYVRTETGDEFRMNTPTGSAAAEVGGALVVERSGWTGRPLALVIDDRRHGAGQDLGTVLRGLGLVMCAGVVALLGLALLQIGRHTVVGMMMALVIAVAGAWLGSSLLLVW